MSTTTRSRLSPEERRSHLLALGVRILATGPQAELSTALLPEEAGISGGLLYPYFGKKPASHEAVVRRAADDLIAQTAPPAEGEPLERLLASVAAYVDYVLANFEGYLSLIRGAAGGNETLRRIYEDARSALSDRIFREDAQGDLISDTPRNRLIVRAWAAMSEELVVSWREDPCGVTREELLELIAGSLPALIDLRPADRR